MNTSEKQTRKSFNEKIATFIVDKRKAFYLIYICLSIFCIISTGWVVVNNDLTDYLGEDTETKQGMTIMNNEFITYGTASVMVDHLTYPKAEVLKNQIKELEGVKEVIFDNTEAHYKEGSALFAVTFEGSPTDAISIDGLNTIKEILEKYDVYIYSEVGNVLADTLEAEMQSIMVVSIIIIIGVLLFTSKTYMEIPVLLLTFGVGALLNMGTNYWFGTVSFISNSIAVVLQLALAIDYAIILCHRYMEEREHLEPREAVIVALSKAIVEISGSSLTTLSGLVAMTFMQFRIGYDMGVVLIKAIIMSLLSVFTLMPGLLLSFSRWIDRTQHKNFIPNITLWGVWILKLRKVVPPLFIGLVGGAFIFSSQAPYAYGYTVIETTRKNESQIARDKIEDTFGRNNALAMIVPMGDYEAEEKLLKELEQLEEVDFVLGLANTEAMEDYLLTSKLTPRAFSELVDMDIEQAMLIYAAYATSGENYGKIVSGIENYSVSLIDIFSFVYEQVQEGYVVLDQALNDDLEVLHSQLEDAKKQLLGDEYSRFVMNLHIEEEGEETFEFLEQMRSIASKYYLEDEIYLVGNATNNRDLAQSFERDNVMISILSCVFVMVILLLTFQSAGVPVLLILVIQGSVWMNFSFPYIEKEPIFFMGYLVVSAIQMGANIDYAIVMTNRYTQLKQVMDKKDAVVEALNQAFPTILTSGSILAISSFLIGYMSSDAAIASIGICLGRGTVISIILVMCVLPQLLYVGDTIIERTSFSLHKPVVHTTQAGTMKINGRVKGYIQGMVDGNFSGTLQGSMDAVVVNKESKESE